MADKAKIIEKAVAGVRRDGDAAPYAEDVRTDLERLLAGCDASDGACDDYTRALVRQWISLSPSLPGGSRNDYCADGAMPAFADVCLRINDRKIEDELVKRCNAQWTLYPDRELGVLRDAGVIS